MNRTELYAKHCALGAKMVSFAGWEMPLQYKGVLVEHQAVRQAVGLFDVSHMGRILVEGPDAELFLNYLATNQITGKKPGEAVYTVLCHSHGGAVDDVIMYKQDLERFFVTVNAGNRRKDLEHLEQYSRNFRVALQERYQEEGILA